MHHLNTTIAKVLKDALQRVEARPKHAQSMLPKFVLEIDQEIRVGKYQATPVELASIDRGLKMADEGRFASDEKVDAAIAKHRPSHSSRRIAR